MKQFLLLGTLVIAFMAASCDNPTDAETLPPPTTGTGDVSLSAPDGAEGMIVDAAAFTISRAGPLTSKTLTAAAGWSSFSWNVDGVLIGTTNSITLNADAYTLGKHSVMLYASKTGSGTWSKTVPFTVEN
jgi:hypothetical protein